MKFHPSDMVLEEFYLCQGEEHRVLLAHLVGCSKCALRFRRAAWHCQERDAEDRETGLHSAEYEEVLIQDADSPLVRRELAMAKERAAAPGIFVELTRLSPEQQRLLIRNSPRFRTWGLCELLLERSLEMAIQAPGEAEGLALLALEVSSYLATSHHRAELVQDLRARAWAYLGNARRVRSDLREAEEAFVQAETCLRSGSRDPLEWAMILDLKASLRRAQRQFDQSLSLLGRAVLIFLRNGHLHRAGRSLVNMSTVYHYAGNVADAVPLLSKALELIDPESEPRLLLCARHNLCDYLASSGKFVEAQKAYREALSTYRNFPDFVTQIRRKWVKGRISLGLGRTIQAERLLLAARDGFIAEGIPYDTALVSLELAALYAREGRTADLKRLSHEMFPIFSSLQIHREALAALTFLQKALEAEQVGVELVARVADFLRRAEHDPGLRFEP